LKSSWINLIRKRDRHPLIVAPPSKKGSFKVIVTQNLTTVRGMKITPLLRCPHHYNCLSKCFSG